MPHSFGKISCLTVRGHSDPEKLPEKKALFLWRTWFQKRAKHEGTAFDAGRMHGLLSIAHPHQRFSHPPKRFSIYLFFCIYPCSVSIYKVEDVLASRTHSYATSKRILLLFSPRKLSWYPFSPSYLIIFLIDCIVVVVLRRKYISREPQKYLSLAAWSRFKPRGRVRATYEQPFKGLRTDFVLNIKHHKMAK